MAAGEPITAAALKAMSIEEFAEREAEIDEWVKAGAVDQPPRPPTKTAAELDRWLDEQAHKRGER